MGGCDREYRRGMKNDGFCIKNDGFCIKNDDFCIKNDDFLKGAPPPVGPICTPQVAFLSKNGFISY